MELARHGRSTQSRLIRGSHRMHQLRALYFVFYNFTPIHKMLRMSHAMAAGITDRLWSLNDVVAKIDTGSRNARPLKKREANSN